MSDYGRNFHQHEQLIGVRNPDGEMIVYADPTDDPNSYENRDFVMVCEICGVMLNHFTYPEGESYVHGREWQSYDHEPVPKKVFRTERRKAMCDFCGIETWLNWTFECADRIQAMTGNTVRDYGRIWGACDDCAVFIDARDLDGLIERNMTTSFISRRAPKEEQVYMRKSMYEMLGAFMNGVVGKSWVGEPVKGARLDPRMMPKIQTGLVKFWSHPQLYDRIANKDHMSMSVPGMHVGDETMFRQPYPPGEHFPAEVFAKHAAHLRAGIKVSELYWVSADFTRLAAIAAHDLKTFTLEREDLPSPFGLLIWETPIGEIKRTYGTADFRVVSWTIVPGGIWLNFYIQGEDGDPEMVDIATMRAEYGFLMCPNVGSGMPFGEYDLKVPDKLAKVVDMVTTLMSTMFLLSQPGVADVSTAPVDKKLERSLKRAGKKSPTVKLIDLRKRPRRAAEPAESGVGGWTLKYRRFTKGHWRQQPYGPQRALRKSIYVSPYLSGDDNLPLRPDKTPVVKVLR